MITLRLRFDAGTSHAPLWARATEGDIEWPPQPWGLLQAVVRGWARLGRPERSRFHTIIERLSPPPLYRLPFATSGNSQGRLEANEAEAHRGTLTLDSVLALDQRREVAAFAIWLDATLDAAESALLDAVLLSVDDFVKSAPLSIDRVGVDVCSGPYYEARPSDARMPSGSIVLSRSSARNSISGDVLVAVLDESEPADAERLDRVRTRIEYRVPEHWGLIDASIDKSIDSGRITYRFSVEGDERVDIAATLPFAEAVRGALLSTYSVLHGRPASRRLAGKDDNDASPRRGHDHPHYLPLDLDDDGRIDAVDVFFPNGCSHDEYVAIRAVNVVYDASALRRRRTLRFAGESPKVAGSVWKSVTPIILDRFPKRRGRDGEREIDSPSDQIRKALSRRGFPEPFVSIWPASASYGSDRDDRSVAMFRRIRGKHTPYPAVGATLMFSRDVTGPIALGRFAHFGLGMFSNAGVLHS